MMAVFEIRFLAILLCLTTLAHGQRTPAISHISDEQIQDVGGQVELTCSVLYARDYPVLWLKSDGPNSEEKEMIILSSNSGLIIRDSRYSVQYDRESETYTLTLKDIEESDAGWYHCQVPTSKKNKITAAVELKVRKPPVSDNSTQVVVKNEGKHGEQLRTNARIESTLARIENTLARIEALEGIDDHRDELKMDNKNLATLARIENTVIRIEATLVRIEANQIEASKQQ